jgi:hypothetical protein
MAKPAQTNRPGRTRLGMVAFTARADFHFRPGNVGDAPEQQGIAGERYYSSVAGFVNQALARHGDMFRVIDTAASLHCLPRVQWPKRDYRGRRVLFLLPPPALGEHVATLLFLRAFREQNEPRAIGVFCAASATDIYMRDPPDAVYSLWIGERELKQWDILIDLNHLEERRRIDTWPVDMEAGLLSAFDLNPAAGFPSAAAALAPGNSRLGIGILPLASSPLRTLPVAATRTLVEMLAPDHDITLCLNRNQHQGQLYHQALDAKTFAGIRVIDAFASIGELLRAIDGFDYSVFADSGPAHMSKLGAQPGTAVYTSAPAEVLQGRFENLAVWQSPFKGPYCRAPCGLAKVRAAADGRLGCMGSLQLPLEQLPDTAAASSASGVADLLANPVPCVALLAEQARDLAEFVRTDIARRRAR